MEFPPGKAYAKGLKAVGYHDLNGKPGFKMAIHKTGDRWYLYSPGLWNSGFHILDIDAPESAQFCFRRTETVEQGAWNCGRDAATALSAWIGGQRVTCDTIAKGTHKSWLARCTVAGADLVQDGGAVVAER